MKHLIFFFASFLLSLGTYAQDIRSNTEGLSLSGSFNYINWSSSELTRLDEDGPNGLGGGFRIGYGFNQRFEAFAAFDGYDFKFKYKNWNSYGMSAFTAGLRINLGGTLQPIRPFVEVGYAGQNFKVDPIFFQNDPTNYELRMKGSGLIASAGINYFITQNLALNASLGGSLGRMNSYTLNDIGLTIRPDVRTVQAKVGLSYYIH
jgi:opacity protein-like surface antigen